MEQDIVQIQNWPTGSQITSSCEAQKHSRSLGPCLHPCCRWPNVRTSLGGSFSWRAGSRKIRLLQNFHCAASPCRMNGAEWVNHFISRLLHISHGQWVLQNFTLHDQTRGYLWLQDRRHILEEMDWLADKEPSNIQQESRSLLEVDFSYLLYSSFERQLYWVMATKVARRAGRYVIAHQSCRGATA